jgi:AcrR family transcriptional regulator
VRALAAHAGVAPGMFHYHFDSKEAFLRTLLGGIYEEMFSALSRQSALPDEPLDRLRAALGVLARFARANRQLLARLWTDALAGDAVARDFFAHNAPRHVGLLMGLVLQAQSSAALRAMPPVSVFAFLIGSVALPLIFVAGLVDAGFSPPGGADAFDSQVMSDAAIDERIELALAALTPARQTRNPR